MTKKLLFIVLVCFVGVLLCIAGIAYGAARTAVGGSAVVGNCTDSNVAAWLAMNEASGTLTVPSGCAASTTVLTLTNATAVYAVQAPAGLGNAIEITLSGGGLPTALNEGFVTAGDVAAFDLTSGAVSMVVEGWVRHSSRDYSGITKYDVGADRGWTLSLGANGTGDTPFSSGVTDGTGVLEFYLTDGAGQTCDALTTSASVPINTWAYFRATWDGSTTCTVTYSGNGVTTGVASGVIGAGIDNTAHVCVGAEAFNLSSLAVTAWADIRVTIGNSTNSLAGTTPVRVGLPTSRTALAPASAGNCTDSNVAAYLSMDEASGNLTVPSGCAASGTVFVANGASTYSTSAPSGLGTGITFASTDYKTAGDVNALDIGTNDFVVEFWVRNIVNAYNGIISKCDNGNGGECTTGWRVFTENSTIIIDIRDNGTTRHYGSGGGLRDGGAAWHFVRIAAVRSGSLTMAIDGVVSVTASIASWSASDISNANVVSLGAYQLDTSKLVGSLADLRVTIGNATNNLYGSTTNKVAVVASGRAVLKQIKSGNCTDPNVAAYFSLDETSGNLTVPSGCTASGIVLTANGSPTYSSAAPIGLGTAVNFSGGTSYFTSTSDVASLDPGLNSFVVEAWITPMVNGGNEAVAAKVDAAGGEAGWFLDTGTSGSNFAIRFYVNDGADSADCNLSSNTPFGGWHFVRAVWNASTTTCSVFVNGTSIGSVTNALVGTINTTTPFTIAAWNNGSVKYTGKLADLRVTIGNSTNDLWNGVP